MRISDWSSDVCSSDLVPADLKARVLTTNIDLDEGTCSLDLLEAASAFFALTLPQARAIIKEVAVVTATWRDTAKAVGARSAEITRMASAFEHNDLTRSEEHTSELQSLMRISYAVFCLKKKNPAKRIKTKHNSTE